MQLLIIMIQGFCMALADSVPGVSGGTVAFILGFYDKFILSLHDIVSGNRDERKSALQFLVKLMCGWVIGFSASVLVLGKIFDSHIYQLCSLFLGLSLFAIPIIVREEKDCLKGKYQNLFFTLIGIVIVSLITYFNPTGSNAGSVDILHLSFGTGVYVFLVAMVAISAMVLPGISGSTLLLIFGLYLPIIGAIKEFLHFNFSYFPVLFIFGLGVITGILLVIRVVKVGLERYRSQTMYLILGLVIGSVYAIIMGPTTLEVPKEAMSLSTFHPVYFMFAAVILFGMEKLKSYMEKGNNKSNEIADTDSNVL